MTRTILHVDMDAFYASVEQHDRPELRGKPVIVGATPDQRGVVAACSYEARKFGIHSAMPSREAGQRCPHAVFLPVHMERYAQVSRQIRVIFERFTPLVEPLSIDEAFLDVTGAERLHGNGVEIAAKIKDCVRQETGLTASVGVASNKFLAKLASDLEKPDGLTVVPRSRDDIAAFLAPLPVSRIWGVGRVTQERLEKMGVSKVGHLQNASLDALARVVGEHGARHLRNLAWGEDAREVETEHEEKSISKEHTFPHDCRSREEVRRVLVELADDVGRRLRKAGKYAELARLKLRWQGFKTITRQRMFDHSVCDDFSLRTMADALLESEELIKPVRLIGFGVARLTDHPSRQLDLFGKEQQADDGKKERLSRTVDKIRAELGGDSLKRGSGMVNG